MTDHIQEFRQALMAAGLTPPDMIIPGRLYRIPSNDRRGDTAGWCKLFEDGMGGVYGDHRSSTSETWQFRKADRMSDVDREAFRQQVEQARRERDAAQAASHREAAKKAVSLWGKAQPLPNDHPYLQRKHITAVSSLREIDAEQAENILEWKPRCGKGVLEGRLIVAPVKIDSNMASVELIDGRGWKAAQKDSKRVGGWWAAQPLPEGDGNGLVLIIGEGISTVLSVRQATGHPVVAALSCGNLMNVAQAMRKRYPASVLLILADIGNGQEDAFTAARSVDGMAVIPSIEGIPNMTPEQQAQATDFNDLHRAAGIEAVRHQIGNALEHFTTGPAGPANDEPEPDVGEEIEAHRNAPRGTPAMLYGIFGEIGRIAADGTEANPYAACMNAMVFFSACVGREVYLRIGNGTHHARLFALHVGRSSVGRKGTAMDLLWRIIGEMDRQERNSNGGMIADDSRLLPKTYTGGLSSREGVTHYLHDGILQGETSIPPVHDKRMLVVESEFVNVLHQAGRSGNTLSAALRDLWDGKKIMPLTKNPVGVSAPHVAIYGNITPAELLATLTATDRDNGFINRFIVFHAEMPRLEPFPRSTPAPVVAGLASRLLEITSFAKGGYVWEPTQSLPAWTGGK